VVSLDQITLAQRTLVSPSVTYGPAGRPSHDRAADRIRPELVAALGGLTAATFGSAKMRRHSSRRSQTAVSFSIERESVRFLMYDRSAVLRVISSPSADRCLTRQRQQLHRVIEVTRSTVIVWNSDAV
jgi:hypothetical protein